MIVAIQTATAVDGSGLLTGIRATFSMHPGPFCWMVLHVLLSQFAATWQAMPVDCLFVLPCCAPGANSLSGMGSRVIKVALFSPQSNYPFNSPNWKASYPTLLSMAVDPYYKALWDMPEFDTYVLIAYSTVGGNAGGKISYWTQGITAEQAAEETAQLKACAKFFLEQYAHKGKTFVFENWEGDWASRDGSYDGNKPATDLALASMRMWLQARQTGVTEAREEFEAAQRELGKWWLTGLPTATANNKEDGWVDHGIEAHGGAGGVYFAAEVNLVANTMATGAVNMINRVIPHVALDLVSYSAYDTQTDPGKHVLPTGSPKLTLILVF
eukprot:SAG31_NODE_52_length_30366_cov_34.368586_18_plen_327_part_00